MFVSWMRRLATFRLWRLRKDPHRPEVTLIEVLGKTRATWTNDV